MINPPRIEHYGDLAAARLLKGKGLAFYQLVCASMGEVLTIQRDKRFGDSEIQVIVTTAPNGDKNGVLKLFVRPIEGEANISGFLFKHRWTAGDELLDPAHIAGELSGMKDLLYTDAGGFHEIRHNVPYHAGRSYWTNNKDTLVSWNTFLHDTNTFNDEASPYSVLGKYPYTDDEVYINGTSIGNQLRPFAVDRQGGVYYAKVGRYLIALQYSTSTGTQFFPQGIFGLNFIVYYPNYEGIIQYFVDNLSVKKAHVNAAGTQMVALVKVLPATPPEALGVDMPTTMPVTSFGTAKYTVVPPFTYPIVTDGVFTNYWEAIIVWDIVQTGDPLDPIHLVEVSRDYQYAITAAMKRGLGTSPPIDYTLLDKFENTQIVTDIWYDLDSQVLVAETIDNISVTSWGTYQYNINNPNLAAPLTVSVDCTGTSKLGTGYTLMANNPYVKNTVVTVCDFTGTITETPPANSGDMIANRYDELGVISFTAISDKVYTQTHITGWMYPLLYQWHGYTYDTSAGVSEYSFPYGTVFEQTIASGVWQQVSPSVHFERELWNYTDERVDNSGVLSDRYGNILYFYGEDDFVTRCINSPNQRYAAFTKGFIPVSSTKLAEITNAIRFSEDIIGVI